MKTNSLISLWVIAFVIIGGGFSAHYAHAEDQGGEVRANVTFGNTTDKSRTYQGDDQEDTAKDGNDNEQNENEGNSHIQFGVAGTVTAVSGSTITVKSNRDNLVYTVDATTANIYQNSGVIAISKIVVGDSIIVQGTVSGNTVTATNIYDGQWKDNFPENGNWNNLKPGIMGTVTVIGTNSLTVKDKNGTVYTVNTTNAKFQRDKNATITFSDIIAGDTVIIQGTVTGTNVAATNVFDIQLFSREAKDVKTDKNHVYAVTGKVTAITGNDITVLGNNNTSYVVSVVGASIHAKNEKDSQTLYTISNITVGDTLMIDGTINGTNVSATNVVDANLKANNGEHNGFFNKVGNFFKRLFGRGDN